MDKVCVRCFALQKSLRTVKNHSTVLNRRILQNVLKPALLVSQPRHYATKERATEKIYRHGKLVVEEQEDPFLYPKVLMTISGTDEAALDHFLHFVKKAGSITEVNVTKSFNMPAYEETFRAKREGEGLQKQIEYTFKHYQRIIEVTDLTAEKSDLLLEYVQKSLPAGVKIKFEPKRWEMLVDPNHITLRNEAKR